MPVDKAKVEAVHRQIRSLYKGQLKSSNKSYADLKSSFSAKAPHRDKRAARERNGAKADVHIQRLRGLRKQASVFAYAGILLADMIDNEVMAGNCEEMAILAGIFAYDAALGTVWIVQIGDPGDHAFCVVGGAEPPRWKVTGFFKNDKSDAWVIDPWANVCCPLRDFERLFTQKMEQWAAQGKRILVEDEVFHELRWVVPNSLSYLSGFRTGLLRYIKMENDLPGADKK